jgi:3-deoxy-D-manno-octulosonic-acid transferase
MKLQGEQMHIGLLHKAYSTLYTCALPLIVGGLACRSRGRRRMAERLGSWGALEGVGWWFHAASVGEVQGILPVLAELRSRDSSEKILLSATSPTGLERGTGAVDYARLAPLDAPLLVRRALQNVQCKRFVITETELWPNLLKENQQRDTPSHLINARISDYTLDWYLRLRSVFSPLLRGIKSVSVADKEQGERFSAMGVAPSKIFVTGHTKYDYKPKYSLAADRDALRDSFFRGVKNDELIVVLGSVHEGEDAALLEAMDGLIRKKLPVRFIVTPRHAERFEYYWKRLCELPANISRWSEKDRATGTQFDVLLLDTMGLLEAAYAAGDIAFIGATLVDIGGHNPFEPAMYGLPILVGPFTSVIREPAAELEQAGALFRIASGRDLSERITTLVSDHQLRNEAGKGAQRVWSAHQGASARVLDAILESEAEV